MMLAAMLPSGLAWNREPGSSIIGLLDGIGDHLNEVDQRASDLIDELDPRTTTEMLLDWERLLGLPDECLGTPDSLKGRRDAIVAKLVGIPSPTPAALVALAADIGYTVSIEEHSFQESRCGYAVCGDTIGGAQWGHTFTVHAPAAASVTSRAACGTARCGDPIRSWGNELLECIIAAAKPAHTTVIFLYDQ
jgi:uncharacterized protein YmfQ (DUF2313 family)